MSAPTTPDIEATERRLYQVFADRRNGSTLLDGPRPVEEGEEAPEIAVERQPLGGRAVFHVTVLALAAAFAVWALLATDIERMGDYGLLSALHPSFYVALGLLTVGFLAGVRRGAASHFLAAYIVLFVATVHATPVLLYGTLRYAWAWKHVGIVDLLMRNHAVDTSISFLPVYQNWPGFFGLAATLTEAAGLRSALSFAAWAPPVFELLNIAAIWVIVSALTDDRRVRWTTCWFFVIANWVGQNYFAPQAFVFLLYLVVIGIVLQSLSRRPAAPALLRRIVRPLRATVTTAPAEPARPGRAITRGTVLVLFVMFAAVATSHPLTPIVLTTALAGLALFGGLRVKVLPLFMGAMTVGWLMTGAYPYYSNNESSIFEGFGSFSANLSSNLIQLNRVDPSQQLVAQMGRIQVALVAVLAILGLVRRLKRGHWDAAALVLVVSPLVILVGGNYDGEALFRVFLFALPFAAFFGAQLLYPDPDKGTSGWTTLVAVVVSGAVLAGFLFAYYGKEAWSYFSKSEIRAAEVVYERARPDSLLVEGTRDYPNQFLNAERFTYLAIASEPTRSAQRVIDRPVAKLSEWLNDPRYEDAYVLITRAQKAQIDALGPLPRGSLDRVEEALLESPRFEVLYHDEDASVFRARPSRAER
jgi:hypothetical protein